VTANSSENRSERRDVLVAGVGNVFLGDDGFGVEVARRLAAEPLPEGVTVTDYGIRGLHLAYDLLEKRFGTLILVDVVPVEVDPDEDDAASGAVPDAHGMDPATVLRLLRTLGGTCSAYLDKVFVVGCRPLCVEEGMSLSEPVSDALDQAVLAVHGLIERLRPTSREAEPPGAHLHPEASWTSSSC